jgi:outer membrane protein assembly factor BamB
MPTDRPKTTPLTLILLAGLVVVRATASDWPIFRGPQHNGISTERHWGEDWANCTFKIRWTKSVGLGASAVSVADGRLYTLGNSDLQIGSAKKACDVVYCLDAESGAPLWSYSYVATLAPNSYEGGTNTTPTVAGDRVYTLSKQGLAHCFDAKTGAVLWQVDLAVKHGVRAPDWHFAGSPYPYGDLVIYNAGTHGLALHASDGTLAWKTGTAVSGYSTPVPFDYNGQHLLVVGGEKTFAAVEPLTGSIAWEYPWATSLPANIADAVVEGNDLFFSSGYSKGAALVRVSGNRVSQVWFQQKNMQTVYNTAVLWQGYLYGPNDRGPNLTCLEFSTGNVMWNQATSGNCCVALADGRLIVLTYGGELSIAKASPAGYVAAVKGQVLATGSICRTAPVLANGKIYVRSSTPGTLACVELTTTAPRVNAGSSVLTWLKAGATTVTLDGSVLDDTNDVTSIRWSVLSSPLGSAVVLGDPSRPATTASFAMPGLYVLELHAIDAKAQQGSDRIEVRVCADACDAARNRPAGASAATWYDSDADCTADFGDFAVLAAQWTGPRGFKDLALFVAQWLKDTSLTEDVRYDAGEIVLPAN